MSDACGVRWGEVLPFPDPASIDPLARLVPAGGERRFAWGVHPPPHLQTGMVTDVPEKILQAFPVSTKLMYVVGCRDAESLKGDLV